MTGPPIARTGRASEIFSPGALTGRARAPSLRAQPKSDEADTWLFLLYAVRRDVDEPEGSHPR